jgi:hypothetical protein
MAKLLQIIERRRNRKSGALDTPVKDLFPNGEKTAIIRAIHDLQDESETRRREHKKIMEHLGISL